jgi:hypothetical protein
MALNDYDEGRLRRLESVTVKLEAQLELMRLHVALLPHLAHLPEDTIEFVNKALAAAAKGDTRKAHIQLSAVAALVAEQYTTEVKAAAERFARVQQWFPLGPVRAAAPGALDGPGPESADASPSDDFGDPERVGGADDDEGGGSLIDDDAGPPPPRRGLDLGAARDYPLPGAGRR